MELPPWSSTAASWSVGQTCQALAASRSEAPRAGPDIEAAFAEPRRAAPTPAPNKMRRAYLLLPLLLVACRTTPLHYDVGVVEREITTASDEAQVWFDRGLGLTFGFNHQEAIKCFEQAAELDPGCAMAAWGKAYALGPNYNNGVIDAPTETAAAEAAARALALSAGCSPVEVALIRALQARYAVPQGDRAALDAAYADEMRAVRAAFPDDADVAALCGEALMQLRPWGLWSHEGEAAPETSEIRAVLEQSLARWPDHPALCHLYIHAMEAGPEVARAVPAAERLEDLTPGLGHLIHMPSHIYTWVGRYDDVVRVNVEACEVDDAFVDHAGRENFYSLYRLHNYHFVTYGAMWDGRRALALEYAHRLVDEIPPGLLVAVPDLLDIFTATPYHAYVRFGMWDEVLAAPEPAGELHAARAVWRYARCVALASVGRVEEAEREQVAFSAARAAVPASRLMFQNPVSEILGVADRVVEGEIAYRRGEHERAFAALREAVRLDELLNYDEPWGWMEPARHALGALLTEQGRFEEALAVYEANLARYPENGWALHGMAECLEGLGRREEAAVARARFTAAWARSDVEIPGSCFCKSQ